MCMYTHMHITQAWDSFLNAIGPLVHTLPSTLHHLLQILTAFIYSRAGLFTLVFKNPNPSAFFIRMYSCWGSSATGPFTYPRGTVPSSLPFPQRSHHYPTSCLTHFSYWVSFCPIHSATHGSISSSLRLGLCSCLCLSVLPVWHLSCFCMFLCV